MLAWIERLVAGIPYLWQQDSASCHTSRKTQCEKISTTIWPLISGLPNYPNCNTLDYNVWSMVQRVSNQIPNNKKKKLKTLILFTNPSAREGYDTRSIFKRSLTGLNSEFSFSYTSCLTKAEEPSLPYYLPIAGGRIIGFIPFAMVLVLCEMKSVSSRIWTRIAVSDYNHYTTGTSVL